MSQSQWHNVCDHQELAPNGGVCALIAQQQIAIFHCQRTDSLYAVDNFDPIGKANVLSRGIIGSIDNEPYVASPLYKQHFHLIHGDCLEQPEYKIQTFVARNNNGVIQVKIK